MRSSGGRLKGCEMDLAIKFSQWVEVFMNPVTWNVKGPKRKAENLKAET